MTDIKFPEVKTFYQEVEEIAHNWAKQNNCSYAEATEIILSFASRINAKAQGPTDDA